MVALVILADMGFFFWGPTLAMTQGLPMPRMRATGGALLLLSPVVLWAAMHFYLASRHLVEGYLQAGLRGPDPTAGGA
jgi:hypothetical protein